MQDAFDTIFQLFKLKSSVYFQRDFWAPWAMQITDTGFAQFHIIVRGHGVAIIGSEAVSLSAGDVLLFPKGHSHVVASEASVSPVAGQQVMSAINNNELIFSEGDRATRLICGHYEYQIEQSHPIIEELPEYIHIQSSNGSLGSDINATLSLLMLEIENQRQGCSTVVQRLSEVLLMQLLRIHYDQSTGSSGFHAALADPQLARVINRIHNSAADALTLENLAQHAGMSRSGLAERFKATVQLSPIKYLTQWRMMLASDQLRSSSASITEVAESVGYDNTIAFNRAFKREFGQTPFEWRRGLIQKL